MRLRYSAGVLIVLFILGTSLVGPIMSNVEEPSYVLEVSDSNIEIRRYSHMVVAEVQMPGDRGDAIREGFRMIADYIFGNNSSGKKISMTAPVQQQFFNDTWRVNFVMPGEYSRVSLPEPITDRILLREIPATRFIVIKFSGSSSINNLRKHEESLNSYVEDNQIDVKGGIKYAFYNPPWTLPFMRRNELMLELEK